jgi:hypothetical protein
MKMLPVLFLLLFVASCSPQKSLANRLKEADRVVITNVIDHSSISVTGTDAEKIVQAIATAKKNTSGAKAVVTMELKFYKGREDLGVIESWGPGFSVKNAPYDFTADAMDEFLYRLRLKNASSAH